MNDNICIYAAQWSEINGVSCIYRLLWYCQPLCSTLVSMMLRLNKVASVKIILFGQVEKSLEPDRRI